MKKIILLCTFMMLCISSYAQSGFYEPVAINPNDLNGDVVMGPDGIEPRAGIDFFGLDEDYCFYSNDCPNAGQYMTYGLPGSTNAPNGAGVNIPFDFTWTGNGQFNGKDAIHLRVHHMSVTVNLQEESCYNGLCFLATLGGSVSSGTIQVTVTYTDNTTDVGNFTINNWHYSGPKPANALQSYYYMYLDGYNIYNENSVHHSDNGPCLYCVSFNGSLNQTKLIKSLTFSQSDINMFTAIFAITGVKNACFPKCPQNLSGTHTNNSTTITFDVIKDQSGNTITNANYVYYVARDPNFKSIVTGHYNQPLTNTTVANGRVSGTINGDLSGLYFRVRAKNNCGISQNSATFAEQGDSIYTVNVADVPNCSVAGCLSGSKYKSGETITLTASVSASAYGWSFGYWADSNGNQLSTDNPYTHTVTQDITIHPVLIAEQRTFPIAPGITAQMGTLAKGNPWIRTTDKPGLSYRSTTELEIRGSKSCDTLIITPEQGYEYAISFVFEMHRYHMHDNTSLWINDSLVFAGRDQYNCSETYSYNSGNTFLTKPDTIVISSNRINYDDFVIICNSNPDYDQSYIYNIKVTSRSNSAPAKPVLTSCSHNNNTTVVTFNEVTTDINGNPVASPLIYEYDLARDSCFTEIIPEHEGQPLNVTTSDGVSTGTISENLSGLYVRIRAINVNGMSSYSNVITDDNPDVYAYEVVVPTSNWYVLSGYTPGARYKAGESVNLSASLKRNRGIKFKGWADGNDVILSTDKSYTHTFPQTATGSSSIQHVTLKPLLDIEVREYAIAPGVTARMGTLDKDRAWIRYYDEEAPGLAYISAVNFRSAVSRDTLVITPDQGVAYALSFECHMFVDQSSDSLKMQVNDSTFYLSFPPEDYWKIVSLYHKRMSYNSGDKNLLTGPTTIIMTYTMDDNDIDGESRCYINNLKVSVPYTVTAKSNNTDMGSVAGGGYYLGTQEVTLTATPKSGYRFKRWSDGSKANPYKLTVDRDTDITAIFDIDHLSMPLCFTAKGGNVTVKFDIKNDIKNVTHTIQYSTDKVNWETYTSNTAVTLANDGDKVYFRAETDQTNTNAEAFGANSGYSQFFFTSDNGGKVEASGNIMSLYGPSFPTLDLPDYAFSSLFRNCSIMTTAPALPATTLAANCYKEMFYGCSSLKVAPELPATTLASSCYSGMFRGCSSLTAAPELPATTLASSCYSSMFYGCSSLKVAPELPVTTLEKMCYENMFDGCSSLKAAPELPATILKERCYAGMFHGCTSLTTLPELHATTLAASCYSNMFNSCKSLTTLPTLPATTLADDCYNYMFYGCSALEINTQAPGIEWSIPANATGGNNLSLSNMFLNTMGTRPETPQKGTTYYVAPYKHFKGTVSSNWNVPQNWSGGELPNYKDNVTIDVPCTVDNNNATCRNLAIIANATLTVNADAVLDVKGKLTSSDTTCLMLKASEDSSATVLFASGSPKATVESYIKGSIAPDGENNNPDWQYRGFIGNNYPSTSKPKISGWNVVIFKWDEGKNSTNCWGDAPVYNTSGSYDADPWVGYSMANYSQNNPIYHYTTTLVPTTESHEYSLTYTGETETPNRGVNLLTNSWSAPIDMTSSDVTFIGNVEHTFYFFKTRDHQEWSADKTGSFVVYPQHTGEAVYGQANSEIPSSQSFLVKATGTGAKLKIEGGALATRANGPMYAPGERKRLSLLGITISTDSQEDRLFLVESEECSDDFDNGYDGTKIRESGCPQIFAHNAFGNTAVNADSTILGQKIGYSAPADAVQCTISFDTERLSDYSELYLYDRVLKRYADILTGETYTFAGSKEGEKERFEIVGRKNDGSAFVASDNQMVEVTDGRVLLSGFEGSNEMVFITDIAGRCLWSEKSANGPLFDLPTLPAGIYVIYCGNVNCKFVVK